MAANVRWHSYGGAKPEASEVWNLAAKEAQLLSIFYRECRGGQLARARVAIWTPWRSALDRLLVSGSASGGANVGIRDVAFVRLTSGKAAQREH